MWVISFETWPFLETIIDSDLCLHEISPNKKDMESLTYPDLLANSDKGIKNEQDKEWLEQRV